ncbi:MULTISPECIES: histidine--tRNA ligase [Clostridium]|uniref:Histidine--tRNA ligase n=1 Tax=Clostridium novyi (strain NT) TaxID=386415 RepID=SYH_CLONN|nr:MULTISPECIES: histidine--tRNA ligase [Clostridium]A0PZW9.1 RecName: Full=Histidine--tRNA ligase; AltName: Full=Histidyl-tRNA synthetase; Short=HisRS [Clostridium novyi NT]ABK61733.1 histidyl-tRNA synthetase [Clostridium novyi NT]KEH88378.1 histidyl-tRNA synthetase [Clostridium novyi A str. NCTC 538]KEH88722.1 histidyl-tRNA synthetase [Clostridium novyi A str. 4540]KEH89040.1 histidyl-tRNA synthetase [Clostridium novyi A str. BKT29909]KEH94345.1 histidyl-tRNA synthetase [Clostridium botulin
MAIQAPKGTKDLLPMDSYKWHYIEDKLKKLAAEYALKEIRTPAFEHTELFERGVGETTDVVQKEMYTFKDKGDRSITLKPEGTAPAARAFIENGLFNEALPIKMFYFTPVFRYENVQKGRLREHHQFGVEVFGSTEASVDAELIGLAMRAFKEFRIDNLELNINNIGCPECRKKYNDALREYFRESYDELCDTCKTRFERNPMRLLDCKNKKCKEIGKDAPVILDYVCDDCSNHFENLKTYLDSLNIKYKVNPYIVRGLDYYTKTVFEIINNDITVCGGGRYNGLIEQIGGKPTPAVGFGMGIERLILTLMENNIEIPKPKEMDIFIGSMGDNGKIEAFKLVNALRTKGLKAECDHMNKSVKAQMKYANKIDASYSMIIGDTEIEEKKANLKRMEDGQQFEVSLNNLDEIASMILK